MTLTEILQLKEKCLQYDDLRALDYCEKRWQQEGHPTERWELINFIERMLQELKANGIGYPKVLLLRKKEIQRNAFTIQRPGEVPVGSCSCYGGWLLNGTLCPCPKGNPHREDLVKRGMRL